LGTITRGGLLGTLIGAVPGIGSSVANLVSYGTAKRRSKNPETFGKGNPRGAALHGGASRCYLRDSSREPWTGHPAPFRRSGIVAAVYGHCARYTQYPGPFGSRHGLLRLLWNNGRPRLAHHAPDLFRPWIPAAQIPVFRGCSSDRHAARGHGGIRAAAKFPDQWGELFLRIGATHYLGFAGPAHWFSVCTRDSGEAQVTFSGDSREPGLKWPESVTHTVRKDIDYYHAGNDQPHSQ